MQQAKTNTFPRQQRLKSRKKLQEVFSSGSRIHSGTIKLLYLAEAADKPDIQCGVGTSSRYFKKAADRNRIKRLLREAYRLQQQPVKMSAGQTQTHLSLFLLFTGKALPLYNDIYKQVGKALQKLENKLHAMDP
ncbi:ribonuclease P protein component [Niabella drilacis]|uniref:Ribonuclease P protein component n=1 Tax=Niabella drilacis (strain DSM 25811 / CCM 8410 / CCUG 62505 / LMG 26954 / E90) TaxID=1285928 RepID=A0A1G6NG94_NIADE|nr:ribonuclease P protein component [Niabella drilacis]SDC66356.1 ribonuclease P protein component [Niabella drilacis]